LRGQDPESTHAAGIPRSVRVGEQNLYTRSKVLVGDRNPREEEFSIQMRPMDSDKTGSGLGVPVLVALCRAFLGATRAEGLLLLAHLILADRSARRQLNDLPDDLWTKISIEFYKDASDAVFKSLVE
jgi:ATP-dependent Lon protease